MTTIELVNRLMPHTGRAEFTELGADLAALMAQAIHAGVQAFYQQVPPVYRQTSVTWQARPPRSLSLAVVEGSADVVGEPFAARERGCTLLIDGDDFPHEVAGAGRLARAYDGVSGTKDAVLYGDAIPVSHVYVEQIIGPVRVAMPGQARGSEVFETVLDELPMIPTLGVPRVFVMQAVGMSHVVDAGWMLRLSPAPSSAMQVRFRAQVFPPAIGLAECLDPLPLPVRPVDEQLLIDICAGKLAEGALWGGDATSRSRAQSARDRAILDARALPAYLTTPTHAIGIP